MSRDYDDGLIDATYAGDNPSLPHLSLGADYHKGWAAGRSGGGDKKLDAKFGKLPPAMGTVGDVMGHVSSEQFATVHSLAEHKSKKG